MKPFNAELTQSSPLSHTLGRFAAAARFRGMVAMENAVFKVHGKTGSFWQCLAVLVDFSLAFTMLSPCFYPIAGPCSLEA